MKECFADSFVFLALLNRRDAHHARAARLVEGISERLVTTPWVWTEVADAMSRGASRAMAVALWKRVCRDPKFILVAPSQALLDAGMEVFASRPDKDWSLTDCISFVVMRERGIQRALTGDRHFVQAGFEAILADEGAA